MGSEDVAIFWDYENCHAAANLTGYEIVKKIRSVAHAFGTVKLFKAYLELSDPATFAKSLALRSELQSSGVSLTDCPHNGRKDVADKMMLVDMLAYAIDNPPPTTIVLISGDRDFAYAVSVLRLRQYRVVIISLPVVHTSLKVQASIFLDWNNDVLGAEVAEDCWSHNSVFLPAREERRSLTSHYPRKEYIRKDSLVSHLSNKVEAESDIDIMEHLLTNKRNYIPNFDPLGQDISRNCEDASKDTNTQPSPSRTPYSRDDSKHREPTPNVKSPPSAPSSPYTHGPSPSLISANSLLSTPHFDDEPSHQPKARELILPSPIPEAQRIAHASDSPQPSSSPAVSKASVAPGTPRIITEPPIVHTPQQLQHYLPLPTTIAVTPNGDGVTSPHMQQKEPKAAPPAFSLLVQRLQHHRLRGLPHPLRSSVAVELATQDHTLYRRAGTERFGQYVALAEKAGIIELGGREGGAWISLRPDWYNAITGS